MSEYQEIPVTLEKDEEAWITAEGEVEIKQVPRQPNDSEIANLEFRVVEAAVAKRQLELRPFRGPEVDGGKYETAVIMERHAVDALITAREAELKEE